MGGLNIRLLGGIQVLRDEQPVLGFESDKVRALLAYLAIETDKPHRREMLAALLWSEQAEAKARASLSQALYNLHQVLGPACLEATSQSIQLLPGGELQVDVIEFERLLSGCTAHAPHRQTGCARCLEAMEQAVSLYRGDFLQGLSVRGAPEFDDWCTLMGEELRRGVLEALGELAENCELRGELAAALPFARRAVELDAYAETAQRTLMRLLALSGERNAALAQYKKLSNQLMQELGVEPEAATQALHARLKAE